MASNPALNDKVFQKEIQAQGPGSFTPGWGSPADELPPGVFAPPGAPGAPGSTRPTAPPTGAGDTMRVSGTMSAAGILLALLVVAGWFGWQATTAEVVGVRPNGTEIVNIAFPAWLIATWIGGFVLAIVTIFKPKLARITGPLYAVAEGLLVGAISRAYEVQFNGIVLQAVGLTIGVFVMMLVMYATGVIKVTNRLRRGIFAATGAVAIVYLVSIVMHLFGSSVPMIHDAGPVGIGFSLIVVAIAASNLLLDFDFIERGAAMGAPRYMEWFGAFGLLLTLVWLYLEILRLISKLRSR